MLFDTHTHLDQEEFDAIRPEVLARAREVGVIRMVLVGTTARASRRCVELASEDKRLYAAVGIQPNYVAESAADAWDEVVRLAAEPGIVAVGETGLDRHWDYTPFEQQQDYFDRHIRLAQQVSRPFIVHMRDCDEDILQMLREAYRRGPLLGIMHSFTGSPEMATECLEMGMHISIAGMVTFKKSSDLRACAATLPDDRLLLETDAPYLSPEPVRGKRPNEPANLLHTATRVAEARGVSLQQLAAQTTANARALFGV
jgi:TatD DNase family protein